MVHFGRVVSVGLLVITTACGGGGGGGAWGNESTTPSSSTSSSSPSSSSSTSSSAVPSYGAFKAKYTPHDRLLDAQNRAAAIMNYMEPDKGAAILDEYLKPGGDDQGRKTFIVVLTSMERPKAGAMIDHINAQYISAGMQLIPDDYILDLLFYSSETTYDRVKADIPKLRGL